MKIRNGFVSNSSSSSFIVMFPKKPETVEELLGYMFPGASKKDIFENPWNWDDEIYTKGQIAKSIFAKIDSYSFSVQDLKECFENGLYHYNDYPYNYFDNNGEIKQKLPGFQYDYYIDKYIGFDKKLLNRLKMKQENLHWSNKMSREEYNDALEAIIETDVQKFMETHGDKYIFICILSDNDGTYESILEHGEIFKNLEHIRISHH